MEDNTKIKPRVETKNIDILKRDFSRALAKVLSESEAARTLIKSEALKKINCDYDVLYEFIKNEPIENGYSFKDLLLKHIDKESLDALESLVPTLTLFVPELPNNCFSAALWNASSDVPVIAMTSKKENGIPMFSFLGEEWTISNDLVPLFPVIVVKENERIVLDRGIPNSNKLLKSTSSKAFCFIDENFDNTQEKQLKRGPTEPTLPTDSDIPLNFKKNIAAYDHFSKTKGWHRDFVYYDLTPVKTRGALDKTITENLVAIKLKGDGAKLLSRISDSDEDPRSLGQGRRGFAGWTDGDFEFLIKVNIGNKAGFGTEIVKRVSVRPDNLFTPIMEWVTGGGGGYTGGYSRFTGQFILKTAVVNQPLFDWDLESFSYAVKIEIEEYDEPVTKKETQSSSFEFATNFGFNSSIGKDEKIGLSFGGSTKQARTLAFEKTYTEKNDPLDGSVVSFGDDIIISKKAVFVSNTFKELVKDRVGNQVWVETDKLYYFPDFNPKYDTGSCYLYIAPLKMY